MSSLFLGLRPALSYTLATSLVVLGLSFPASSKSPELGTKAGALAKQPETGWWVPRFLSGAEKLPTLSSAAAGPESAQKSLKKVPLGTSALHIKQARFPKTLSLLPDRRPHFGLIGFNTSAGRDGPFAMIQERPIPVIDRTKRQWFFDKINGDRKLAQNPFGANPVATVAVAQRAAKPLPAPQVLREKTDIGATIVVRRSNKHFRKHELLAQLIRVKPQGLPIRLAAAVVTVESNWRPNVRGSSGEYGLMQLMPGTALQFAPRYLRRLDRKKFAKLVMRPKVNMHIGTRVLHYCYKKAKGNVPATIGCYNRGPGKMWQWNGNPITRRYVYKVRRLLNKGRRNRRAILLKLKKTGKTRKL